MSSTEEQNPLQDSLPLQSSISKGKNSNRSGRPIMKNMVKFGPQPKSIVARMLCEKKTKKDAKDKGEIICLDDQSEDSIEDGISEDHVCSICSYRSTSIKEHEEHLTKHKQLSCDFPKCSYTCKLSSNLIKHKRVHSNEKPYLCETCCFRSNFVNSLKVHKRTHTAERPYRCVHCSYRCNSSSNLKKHCRHRHPDTNNCPC